MMSITMSTSMMIPSASCFPSKTIRKLQTRMHSDCGPKHQNSSQYVRTIKMLGNELRNTKQKLNQQSMELISVNEKIYKDRKTIQQIHEEELAAIMEMLQNEQIKNKQLEQRRIVEYRIIREMVCTLEYELSDLHKAHAKTLSELTETKIKCIALENDLSKTNSSNV